MRFFLNRRIAKGIIFFSLIWFFRSAFFAVPLSAEESILFSYERNFIRASLTAKPRILLDAATDDRAGEFIGVLCDLAFRFALDNQNYFRDDADMITLVGTAARVAAAGKNTVPVKPLWELFQVYKDSYSRVEILGALAVLGKGDTQLVMNLNQFLTDENNLLGKTVPPDSRTGAAQDYPVLRACVAVLGELGDSSSFPVLFSTMTRAYSQAVTRETLKALEAIEGNYKDYLLEVIRENPAAEKAAAFRIGAYNEKLTVREKGELVQAALEASLGRSGPAETSLRYDAVTVLTRLKWSPAASLAIRNFYQVQTDYAGGIAPRERFLEAAACLGAMGTSEAAQALALQLGYYNSQTEKTGDFDEAVILALVNALGELGDKTAFDNLLYISYLNYPDKIQASAREALNRLKW